MKMLITLAAGLILSVGAFAQPKAQLIKKVEASPDSYDLAYQVWELPNGLTIIVHEDKAQPTLHVQVTYHVGSARESAGKSGFAHLYEHMMFQGSRHVGDNEHFKIISESGGWMNGTTNRDRTNYFQTVPSNQLETVFWLESDRMAFILDSITTTNFENQRSVVKKEKSQGYANPYQMGIREIRGKTLYPKGHPYSWPVIGYTDDLDRVEVDDVRDFFLRWYGPNNAVVVVTGDVETQEVIKLAEKYFGPIPKGPEVKKMRPNVPRLAFDQYGSYVEQAFLPMVIMDYPTVPVYHPDEPALDMLAYMMGTGKNSAFYQKLEKTEEVVNYNVFHSAQELSGEFTFLAMPEPNEALYRDMESYLDNLEKELNELEQKMKQTILGFEEEFMTEEALRRGKAQIKSQVVSQLESIEAKGFALTQWALYQEAGYNFSNEMQRYENVTLEDIKRVYYRYLKNKNAAIVNIYPRHPRAKKDSVESVNPYAGKDLKPDPEYANLEMRTVEQDFVDRSQRPEPASAKLPVVPDFYKDSIESGIEVIGHHTDRIPQVYMRLEIEGGRIFEDPKQWGVSSLVASMMDEGTANFTAEELDAKLEALGSSIRFSASNASTNVFVSSLSENVDETVDLLQEMLLNPVFDEETFERIKKQTLKNLRQQENIQSLMASRAHNYLLYGENFLGSYTSPGSVKKVSLDDVKAYYQQYYTPQLSKIVITGDIKEEKAMANVQKLNSWSPKENGVKLPKPSDIDLPDDDETVIYIAHKPYTDEAVIRAGHLSLPFDATGDHFKCDIMNYTLGGSFNSRLNLNLREEKGLTYGIRSWFSGSKYAGNFAINTSVKNEKTDTAILEIINELNKMKTTGITEEELDYTKQAMLNNEALDYSTLSQKAQFLHTLLDYDLPGDFKKQQAAIVNNITKAEIDRTAQKYLKPDKLIIVVSGNKYILKKPLKKLKVGKVKDAKLD